MKFPRRKFLQLTGAVSIASAFLSYAKADAVEITLIAEGLQFPEGPIALDDGSIIITEMERGTLTRVLPNGRTSVVAECGGEPNGAKVGPDGAIYVTNNGGSFSFRKQDGLNFPGPTPASHVGGSIQRVNIATGKVETVFDSCDGQRLVGPNDLVFDKQGGFWFTDYGCETQEGRKWGALYYARPDGSKITRARGRLITPNGVGLSPDERVVYMADTLLGRLWAFDVERPGVLMPPVGAIPGRVICNLPGVQYLDSMAVEASGKVCVATIFNGGITVFDPNGSTEHFPFPDVLTTNICFGGPDMRDAWVTCTSTGKLFKCRWPRPGLRLNFNA